MSLLQDLYHKTLAENEKNVRFWEDYLQNLKSLDFNSFSDKLKVPVLVPVGSKILFRGVLKHTNEITVALGADYFVKCSLKQAEVLRQHRIKGAQSKLETFRREREYLENQLSFSKESVFANTGEEIMEVHNEEEEKSWRKKHRENVRKWKQKGDKTEVVEEKTDEELWERLEELELKEELENELAKDDSKSNVDNNFVVREETTFQDNLVQEKQSEAMANAIDKQVTYSEDEVKPTGKYELLQKVIDKQNELEEKLMELRFKDRSKSKTQEDLIAKLDEMDDLEELQDEMDRLEDIIETEDKASSDSDDESSSITQQGKVKRRVSFAADDEPETMELSFHHTDTVPCIDPYNPAKGITKPSDIYEAYSNFFNTTSSSSSILKKTKREDKSSKIVMPEVNKTEITNIEPPQPEVKTIVVGDVVEKAEDNKHTLESNKRPVSLFKQRRQQKK